MSKGQIRSSQKTRPSYYDYKNDADLITYYSKDDPLNPKHIRSLIDSIDKSLCLKENNNVKDYAVEFKLIRRFLIKWLYYWNQADIRKLILNFPYNTKGERRRRWRLIRARVIKKAVEGLHLPTLLRKRLIRVIRSMGTKMFGWWILHRLKTTCIIGNYLPTKLSWTSEGGINEVSMVEVLVKDKENHFTVEQRFRLACVYHLTEHVYVLGKELPEEKLAKFRNGCIHNECVHNTIVRIWTEILFESDSDSEMLENLANYSTLLTLLYNSYNGS